MTADTPPTHDFAQMIQWFRHATPYINQHRNKTFVVMLGSDAVAHSNIVNIVHDVALLTSLGIRIVIVHGVRSQLDKKLDQLGIKSEFVKGLRLTDKTILNAAIEASSLVRAQLETQLSMGLPNSPMHGAKVKVASCNAITAKPAGIIDGIDLQHTGIVRKIDTDAINTLLDLGNLVLLSPVGYSPTGDTFSLSYQNIASELAIAMKADKLIAFGASDGLSTENGTLLRELNTNEAKAHLNQQPTNHSKYGCANAAIHAVEQGVPRAHLMNYTTDGVLLQELFSVDGAGTLILNSQFEDIRSATRDDIAAIIDIISPLEEQHILVKREREKLYREIDYFTVIEREGLIIAIAALYPFANSQMGEIACIATHTDYRNSARGSKLLKQLEQSAKEQNLTALFVLTTQTTHWFIENGFNECSLEQLPTEKQALYNFQRNSKVLMKPIV